MRQNSGVLSHFAYLHFFAESIYYDFLKNKCFFKFVSFKYQNKTYHLLLDNRRTCGKKSFLL
jgi:hypothetical protein